MNNIERKVLKKAIESEKGLHSPVDMINVFADHNRGLIENLVAKGYLEIVPEVIQTGKSVNFYRVTEKSLIQFEPFYKKVWYWFKGDVRTIIVSAITTIIVAVITLWLGLK